MKDTVKVLEVDRYEIGIIVNALVELRNNLIKNARTTDPVDELLLKTMESSSEKKPTYKRLEER